MMKPEDMKRKGYCSEACRVLGTHCSQERAAEAQKRAIKARAHVYRKRIDLVKHIATSYGKF